jgi:hypothetical protein
MYIYLYIHTYIHTWLENITTEPHAHNISADIVRVWLSGYILQHTYIHTCIHVSKYGPWKVQRHRTGAQRLRIRAFTIHTHFTQTQTHIHIHIHTHVTYIHADMDLGGVPDLQRHRTGAQRRRIGAFTIHSQHKEV